MAVNKTRWHKLMKGWTGVMLLTACQFILIITMINDITVTKLLPESGYGSLQKEVILHPENASWWLYPAGLIVITLGLLTLLWRPFQSFRQNVVTIFFLGAVPILFSATIMANVIVAP